IARRFAKVRARSRLRPDPPIAVTAAIQVFGENSLLAPAAFHFPGDDRLVEFPAPTALLPPCGQLHQLLCNRGRARDETARFDVTRAGRSHGAPVNAGMLIK